ncbi:MAG: hypothetical protein NUV77_11040, partial [Thermoguttaceae bacterium]|nr:hypothetical protein [Thermoguttaceae bacterium]
PAAVSTRLSVALPPKTPHPAEKRKEAIRQARRFRMDQEMRHMWEETVKAAEADFRRRRGLGLANVLRRLADRATKLVAAALLLAIFTGVCYLGWNVFRSVQTARQ